MLYFFGESLEEREEEERRKVCALSVWVTVSLLPLPPRLDCSTVGSPAVFVIIIFRSWSYQIRRGGLPMYKT